MSNQERFGTITRFPEDGMWGGDDDHDTAISAQKSEAAKQDQASIEADEQIAVQNMIEEGGPLNDNEQGEHDD